jgi:hypothetical protein
LPGNGHLAGTAEAWVIGHLHAHAAGDHQQHQAGE